LEDLPAEKRKELEKLVLHHSVWHSRKLGTTFPSLNLIAADPTYVASEQELRIKPGSYHTLIQDQPGGRKTMYVSSHAQNVVGMPDEDGLKLITELIHHATEPQYFWSCKWSGPGDMVMWDNRTVMHRATEWAGSDKMVRDMRRTSVFDDTKDGRGVQVSA
jgi:alpha-ketoglutarate-dependent 2,4-dichlorophenoxyacetate dioxygenase